MIRQITHRLSWLTIALLLVALVAIPPEPAAAGPLTDADRAAIAETFFTRYEAAISSAAAVDAFLGLLIPDHPFANVELTYAGAPGRVLPYAGTYIGREGVRSVLEAIRNTSITESFEVEEMLTTSFAVDFSRGLVGACPVVLADCLFLVPQTNRVSAVLEERRRVIATRLSYRLDIVAHLTIEEDGKISRINFFYDSYVPSQAFVGDRALIVNPNIDPVLNPRRDLATDPNAALAAVLIFFFTFGNPAVSVFGDFTPLLDLVTEDVVISFAGDPRFLPFADNEIRVGKEAVVKTFTQQLKHSHPRTFDLREFFVGGDRVIANTFEQRTATSTNRGYEVFVQIQMTSKEGKVGSVQGNFDSAITTTAFIGADPFHCASPPANSPACGPRGKQPQEDKPKH